MYRMGRPSPDLTKTQTINLKPLAMALPAEVIVTNLLHMPREKWKAQYSPSPHTDSDVVSAAVEYNAFTKNNGNVSEFTPIIFGVTQLYVTEISIG